MYLNELVDDFVFGTNHGLNLIVCKTLSYTYTSSWLWGWKELYKLQTQKSVYAMHSTILRGLLDLQKCAKTTQNKTKTILHLYFNCWKKANLCETQIWKYMARQTNEQTRGGGLDTQPILVYFLLRLPEDRSIPSVTTTQHPEIASVDTDTILKTKKKTGI